MAGDPAWIDVSCAHRSGQKISLACGARWTYLAHPCETLESSMYRPGYNVLNSSSCDAGIAESVSL